jgi:hypothetical protein
VVPKHYPNVINLREKTSPGTLKNKGNSKYRHYFLVLLEASIPLFLIETNLVIKVYRGNGYHLDHREEADDTVPSPNVGRFTLFEMLAHDLASQIRVHFLTQF